MAWVSEKTDLTELAAAAKRASLHFRGNHPARATVSFVIVIGADGECVIQPCQFDAVMQLVTQGARLRLTPFTTRQL